MHAMQEMIASIPPLYSDFTLADSGEGSEPEWNETFIFIVYDDTPHLHLKIMDSDVMDDDFVGAAA
jgi:hypothetical protein